MSKYKKKWRYTIQYVKSTAQLVFENWFQKVDQHAGGKWLIHYTKNIDSLARNKINAKLLPAIPNFQTSSHLKI